MNGIASICQSSKQRGNALVLLILLKTWEGDEPPDHYKLAQFANISPRQAERDLMKLVEDGEAERLSPEHNGGRGHKTRYRVKGKDSILTSAQTTSDMSESDKTPSDMTEFSEKETPSSLSEIPETTSHLTDLSDVNRVKSVRVTQTNPVTSDGTLIAPYSDIRTSTDSSSATLRNIVGLTPDAPSVDERAKALRKAIAELPKHKRCAQPSAEEWALMLDIFAEWRREMGKNGKAKLTPERGRAVLDRLRSPVGFTREDFSAAIRGCRASPQHMGQNDRGTVYDDLELICRNDQNLERFKGYAETEGNVHAVASQNRNGNRARKESLSDHARRTAEYFELGGKASRAG